MDQIMRDQQTFAKSPSANELKGITIQSTSNKHVNKTYRYVNNGLLSPRDLTSPAAGQQYKGKVEVALSPAWQLSTLKGTEDPLQVVTPELKVDEWRAKGGSRFTNTNRFTVLKLQNMNLPGTIRNHAKDLWIAPQRGDR